MSLVISKKLENFSDLKSAIASAVDGLGGFRKFIKEGDRVLIKPNINTADPFPASSDPLFVRATSELILENGASEIIIGDSSTYCQNTRKNFEKLNLFELEKIDSRIKVVSFDEEKWIKKKIIGSKFLKSISLPEVLGKVDKIIFLPCLKTHFIAKFTGALKLGVGLMKSRERMAFHASYTEEKIAELNLAFKPNLIIMDGRKCFISGGPSKGELREPDIIMASPSRVSIDREAVKIIQSFPGNSLAGIDLDELLQIKIAELIGIDYENS